VVAAGGGVAVALAVLVVEAGDGVDVAVAAAVAEISVVAGAVAGVPPEFDGAQALPNMIASSSAASNRGTRSARDRPVQATTRAQLAIVAE
jgi:hypothetical protein